MNDSIGEKAGIIVSDISQRLATEQRAAQKYQCKGGCHLPRLLQRRQDGMFGYYRVLIHTDLQQIGHREQPEIKAPADVGPVGTMPKSAETEYDNHVADYLPFLVESTKRKEHVLEEPRVE